MKLVTCCLLLCSCLLVVVRPASARVGKRADFPAERRFASTTVQPLTEDRPVFAEGRTGAAGRSFQRSEVGASTVGRIDQRSPDGSYRYEYLTDNGIHRQETSQQIGFDRIVRGSYSYIGPDNQIYTVNYVADRNGYRAYGAHLPTQPDAVANIINQQPSTGQPPTQQQQFGFVGSTTPNPVFVPSSTIRPIYQRPTGRPQFVTSTTASPSFPISSTTFFPSTTIAPPPQSAFTISPAAQGFGFASTSSTPFPGDFGNGNQLNFGGTFGGGATFSNSFGGVNRPSSTPSSFNLIDVTTPSPFDNGGPTIHITPAPQTFVGNRHPAQQIGTNGGFQLTNGNGVASFGNNGGGDTTGTFFTTGSAFGGGGGAFPSSGLGNGNALGVFNRFPTTAPATTSLLSSFGGGVGGNTVFQQQLPFAQQFGQFNRDEYAHQRDGSLDYSSVQPLFGGGDGGIDRSGGFGGDISQLQPSAFDRVVRRG